MIKIGLEGEDISASIVLYQVDIFSSPNDGGAFSLKLEWQHKYKVSFIYHLTKFIVFGRIRRIVVPTK